MIRAAVVKEMRALLPTCAGTAISLALAALLPDALRIRATLLVLCGGVTALGALAFGHEYACRTLSLMLARPLARRTALAAKAVVLLPMVLLVTALAVATLRAGSHEPGFGPGAEGRALLVLVPLAAVSLAPFLSMVCRSVLAAIVFTIALGGIVMMSGEIAGVALYGVRDVAAVRAFKLAFTWQVMLAACAAGAAGTWWLFMRLEAIEGHADVQLPAWLRTADGGVRRVRSPLATLVAKELRLQQMSFVVVGLYLLAAVALWALGRLAPEFPRMPFEAVSVMYVGLLVLLIGSVAGAEERHLGVVSSQLLLPAPAWQQWSIKAGTAIALALVLGVALPALITPLLHSEELRAFPARLLRQPVLVVVVVLTSFSLYVATVSSSGVRAMINSIPLLLASTALAGFWGGLVQTTAYHSYMRHNLGRRPWSEFFAMEYSVRQYSQVAYAVTILLVAVLLLRFGYQNFRVVEVRHRAVAAHVGITVAVLMIGLFVPAVLWAVAARLL